MGKDIQVYTALDAAVSPAEELDILLLSTEGAVPMQTFNDLEKLKEAFSGKKVAAMADQMFNQKNTLADSLIRRVRVAGIENPQEGDGEPEKILIEAIEALRDREDDWYFLLTDVSDEACVTALCQWAEGTAPTKAELGAGVEDHRKFYFGRTTSKDYVNRYGRSAVVYTDTPEEYPDAAWVGCVGPFWPESVTWKWKVPDGVSVADLRDSERALLEEHCVNFMTAEYKHEYMKNGICGDGNFIDNVLGADYITYQMRENLYRIFLANAKIGYVDEGFALVAAGVFDALNRAVELHIIAKDPESRAGVYTVTVPKRSEATEEQARNRQMPDIEWEAQLEGAVHGAKVNGVLRVTLNQ